MDYHVLNIHSLDYTMLKLVLSDLKKEYARLKINVEPAVMNPNIPFTEKVKSDLSKLLHIRLYQLKVQSRITELANRVEIDLEFFYPSSQ